MSKTKQQPHKFSFHEETARKFDMKAVDAWVKYARTGNESDRANAEWFERAAAKNWEMVQPTEVAA